MDSPAYLVFENYERILGSISAFWFFVLGLLLLILSYWVWNEFKDKFKNRLLIFISSFIVLLINVDMVLLVFVELFLRPII